jgi:hypothetical protein
MDRFRLPVIPPAAPEAAGGSPGPRRRSYRYLWALVALCAFGASVAMARPVIQRTIASADAGGGQPRSTLMVKGRIGGLYPGRHRIGRLTIRNVGSSTLVLRRARAVVGDAGPRCRADRLSVRIFPSKRRMPPGRRLRVPVVYRLSPRANDWCQGARFPLRWSVRATAP